VDLISESEFRWLGRIDNVINSGGIKLFPEQIEEKLQNKIANRFFISAIKDDFLGQKVVLIIESKEADKLEVEVFEGLSKFETPKKIFYVDTFEESASNKINRIKTLKKIKVV